MGKKPEYERQREMRIAENQARIDALQLPSIASGLTGFSGKRKSRSTVKNDKGDVDFEPESGDEENQEELAMVLREDEVDGDEIPHVEDAANSKSKKRTGRGASKPVKSSVPMILEFDDFNLPRGDFEAAYGRQIGQCAQRIDINARNWKKVDQLTKDRLWAETKKMFNIDDPEGIRKQLFERALGARCRKFRSHLKRRFIDKKACPTEGNPNADKQPWEVYEGRISKEQWQKFAAHVASEEFEKRSNIGKQCSAGNIHHHTLGQKSYSRKKPDWEKEKRLPTPTESSTAESSVVSSGVQNRALLWCLAHQSRTKDGKWEVDPKKAETARVVNQVMEHLEKEKEDGGASTSEPDNDALVKALGKKDYGGYVKGIGRAGVGVGHRKAFGKVPRKNNKSRDEEIESLKATIARLESRFEAAIASFSTHSMVKNTAEVVNSPVIPHGKSPVEGPCKCRLAVEDDDGNKVLVADGTYHPTSTGIIHSRILLPGHYRVSIDMPYEEHIHVKLPVPTDDGVTEVGNAKDYFVNWPTSMVLFEDMDNERRTPTQSKEGVGSCDALRAQLSDKADERTLFQANQSTYPPECRLLHELMVEEQHDTVRIPIKAPLLYFEEDQDVWVTASDVNELLRLACINVSVIHVYIRYLIEEHAAAFEGGYIIFLCPQRISAAECARSFEDVVAYLKRAFISEARKKDSQCHYMLAPYIENNHWILLAIDLRAGIIDILDPLAPRKQSAMAIAKALLSAYTAYRARIKEKGNNLELVANYAECAPQTGGTECGYYVMKYMLEFVTKFAESISGDSKNRPKFTARSTPYTKTELDEVREQWAQYFRLNLLLS